MPGTMTDNTPGGSVLQTNKPGARLGKGWAGRLPKVVSSRQEDRRLTTSRLLIVPLAEKEKWMPAATLDEKNLFANTSALHVERAAQRRAAKRPEDCAASFRLAAPPR